MRVLGPRLTGLVASCGWLVRRLLGLCLLAAQLSAADSGLAADDALATGPVTAPLLQDADETKDMPPRFLALYIIGILWLGFLFSWSCGQGSCRRCAMVVGYNAAMIHIPLQWAPILQTTVWVEASGCSSGTPWETHLTYVSVLAAATPVLTMSVQDSMKHGQLKSVARFSEELARGLFPVYLYGITVMGAADQYLDAVLAAAASACEWRLAWAMVVVYFVGVFVQAAAGCAGTADMEGAFYSAMGVSPEGFVHAHEDAVSTRDERLGYQALVGMARLLSENLPQGMLQYLFLSERYRGSLIAYISLFSSFVIGVKHLMVFCRYVKYRRTGASGYDAVLVAARFDASSR
eukprot:TRINITY_DN58419_c0_g1_i1.p1 TRINITY_DN58419_c0_g1~~TRINITY_DN58419_c0_g1_i1.p1  ORF type:complete len:349 (-),score=73.89 TRINITY_DN58419_c0_g1_i1:142-1188(-)